MFTVIKSLTANFPNGLRPGLLKQDINDQIATVCRTVNRKTDVVSLIFVSQPSGGDLTIVDAVISQHIYTPNAFNTLSFETVTTDKKMRKKSILADTTSGSLTVTLPSIARTPGAYLGVKKTVSANTVTVVGDGSDQIEGVSSRDLTTINSYMFLCNNGTQWVDVDPKETVVMADNKQLLVHTEIKGEIIVDTGANIIPLEAGTDGQVLTVDSNEVTGLKWALSSGGITTLNGLLPVTQTFATGTTGTNFNIGSAGSVHTFNIPDASGVNRGLVTIGTQSFEGAKTLLDNTSSTSGTTGALVVTGGVGSNENINATGSITAGNPGTISAKLHVLQSVLGDPITRIETTATNDNPAEVTYQGRVTTNNNTNTNILTWTVPASTTFLVDARIIARRTGGSVGTVDDGAWYTLVGGYKTIGGVTQAIGTRNRTVDEDVSTWNCNFALSGNTVSIIVNGDNNTDVVWHVTARVFQVST
jgi:hypothetical protein